MPKRKSPDADSGTPALRRSARIKNVKTPPVYTAGGSGGNEPKKRRSTARKPRKSSGAESARKPAQKRRTTAGRRSTSKRKRTASPVEPVASASEAEEQPAEVTTDDVMESHETVEDKSEVVPAQEEEAVESSVSMVVNVPSVLESASLVDDSESELKASMASLLEQTAARASTWDMPVPSSETQAESDQLSQNGIFANVSVTAGDERVFGKVEGAEGTDFPLRQELEGLPGGAYVFSDRAAQLTRKDVRVLLTLDYVAESSFLSEDDIVGMVERVNADILLTQNLPSDVTDKLNGTFTTSVIQADSRLQAFTRNNVKADLERVYNRNDILDDVRHLVNGFLWDKLREQSELEVQVLIYKHAVGLEVTLVNTLVTAAFQDLACVELAAVIYFLKRKHRNFVIVGNWNAFPPSNEDSGSVLQVLLGKPEMSTLVASFPTPFIADDGFEQFVLIAGFHELFNEIPRGFLTNFDGENRPASNVWVAGPVSVVAAWQKANRVCGPSLVAFCPLTKEEADEAEEDK